MFRVEEMPGKYGIFKRLESTTMRGMDVSIVIVSYNVRAMLRQCLNAVFEHTHGITFEVIVVDNSSHDGSPQMIRDEFPHIMLVESENKGFGHANNVGAKYAKGKYLFFLNPDTVLLNNAVKILFDFMDNHPKAGICGGNLFDADKKPARSYDVFLPSVAWELNLFSAMRLGKLRYGKNTQFNHTPYPRKVAYITGADLMMKADLFLRLNGFDTDFFVYYEETELAFRVKKAGYDAYSVPQAEIIHLEGKSFSNIQAKLQYMAKSRSLYYKKTHSNITIWFCNSILLFTVLSRIFWFKITGNRIGLDYWTCWLKKL
jgi:GT2 family glycosyltransferase